MITSQVLLDQLAQTGISVLVVLPVIFLVRLTFRKRLVLLFWAIVMSNSIEVDHFFNLKTMSWGMIWGPRTLFHSFAGMVLVPTFSTAMVTYLYFRMKWIHDWFGNRLPPYASSLPIKVKHLLWKVMGGVLGKPKKLKDLGLFLHIYIGMAAVLAHIAWDGPRKVLLFSPFRSVWVTIPWETSTNIIIFLFVVSSLIFVVNLYIELKRSYKTVKTARVP